MMKYVCDTCGKEVLTQPPGNWTVINIGMQTPVPPPGAPITIQAAMYVCDAHDPDTALLLFHEALGTLPPATTQRTAPVPEIPGQ